MSTYALTKARIFQYIGILLVLAFVAAGYWYFAVRAGVKTNSGAVQPQGTDDLSAGLAAYFKLDENTGTSAADSSTNAVTAGTLTNGPTWTTGRIGSAVDFDGTNDYITIPDNDALDFGDTDNMTLTGWFNRDTFTTFDFIMAKNDGVNPGYRIYIDDTADNLHFAVFDGTDMYTLDGFNMSFTTSGWHHFAVVWDQDSPDASEIYVDGVGINATDDGTIGLVGSLANSLALSIGDEIGYNQPFDGKLDEIRIYDRVLSPDTIAKLYQTTVPTGVDTSLKGYWSFDGQDIDGTLVADRSGVGSTGTLTNGPTIVRGQLGQALNFDGTNDYVDAGSATSIDDIVNLTACSWINPETVPGSYAAILAKYNGYGWAFEIDNHLSTRNLMFYRDFSSAGGWWNGPAVSYSEWTHVCVTYNNASAANDPVLYMNGVAVPITEVQTPVGTPVNETNGPLNGGAAWDGAAFVDYFDGKLDEARVYNRILSAAEIKSLYDVSAPDKTNTSASQAQGTGNLDSGLAGYWKLDENTGTSIADTSINARSGTLTNGPTWTTGQIGSGVAFDGTNDYASIPSVNLTGTDNITVSFWLNVSSYVNDDAAISQGSNWNTDGGFVVIPSISASLCSAGQTYVAYRAGPGGQVERCYTRPSAGWHHWTAIYDATQPGAQEVTLYLDGALYSDLGGTANENTSNRSNLTLYLMSNGGTSGFLAGTMDEVRVYDRRLSSDEVSALYRLTTPTGVDTSLKGYWSFNGSDISGTTAYDRSGAGNTGTLTNGPTLARGKLGQALNFDGTNDYVDAGSAAILDNLTQKTVCNWMYPETIPATFGQIVSKNNGGGWDTELTNNSGNNRYEYFQPQSGVSGSWKTPVDSVPFFTWSHVCVSYDNSSLTNDPVMYINGVSVPVEELSTPTGTPTSDASAALRIGAWDGAGELYDGQIDEVRLYNRLLSAAEIKSLYDASAPDKVNTSASQPQGTGNLDSGLAGYWKLDENTGTSASDTSTGGHTGTITNGPTWTTGRIGSALSFDGTNDYVTMGDIDATEGGNSVTAAAWVKQNGATNERHILDKGDCFGGGSWELLVISGEADFYLPGLSHAYAPGVNVSDNQWHHIVGTYDGATQRVYVDGVQGTSTYSGAVTVNPSALAVEIGGNCSGGGSCGGSCYWNGQIDEARVYNRALSADEVVQLYRLGTPTGTDTSLKGYWSFNGPDVAGTTAYDRSGTSNNATLVNGATVARGKLGQAMNFDGTNDYANAWSEASLDNIVNLTACAWVRQDTFLTWAAIVTKAEWELQFANSTSQIEFARAFSGNTGNWRTEGSIPVGTWGHVCVTFNNSSAANDPSIYINGVLQTLTEWNTPAGTASDDSASNLIMGQWTGTGNDLFDGQLDEVRVYNRILSAAEVLALYNQSR